MPIIKTMRKIWICLLAALVGGLAWLAIVPFGSITYQTDLLSPDYFIGPLSPGERIEGRSGAAGRRMIGEPVYFSLFTPRPFRQAEISVEVAGEAPLIEVGLRRGGTVWNFERRPLQHAGLDALARSPDALLEDGLLLWQREKRYASIGQFLENPPPVGEVAIYDYTMHFPFQAEGVSTKPIERVLKTGLRGAYIIETYSDGGAIEVSWTIRDINQNADKDDVTATLYDESGQAVAAVSLTDDAGLPASVSLPRQLRLASGPLHSGAYRLEFTANDDIITDQLATRQAYLSFVNRIWLTAAGRHDLALVSDGSYLTAQTSAPGSRQTIGFDGQSLELAETYQQFSQTATDISRRPKSISLARDDVTLSTDGIFAFSVPEMINPSPRQFTAGSEQATEISPFVIARYAPSSLPDTGRAVFQLAGAYRQAGKYSFLIAAPGVSDEHPLEIRSIRVRLSGPSVWEYVSRALKKYFRL